MIMTIMRRSTKKTHESFNYVIDFGTMGRNKPDSFWSLKWLFGVLMLKRLPIFELFVLAKLFSFLPLMILFLFEFQMS